MKQDVGWMANHGIVAVLNMTAEWPGPENEYSALQPPIQQLRLYVTDGFPPSAAKLNEGITWMEEILKEQPGKRIFIHCKGGMGRAATMALAWFLSKGLDRDDAMKKLKDKRWVGAEMVKNYSSIKEIEAK